MRDRDGNFLKGVEALMARCLSFTGASNRQCEKGIEYKSVEDPNDGLPCFRSCTYAGGECAEATFKTREVAEQEYAKWVESAKKIDALICPDCGSDLIDKRIKEGRHKGHGRVLCPECKEVKMIV